MITENFHGKNPYEDVPDSADTAPQFDSKYQTQVVEDTEVSSELSKNPLQLDAAPVGDGYKMPHVGGYVPAEKVFSGEPFPKDTPDGTWTDAKTFEENPAAEAVPVDAGYKLSSIEKSILHEALVRSANHVAKPMSLGEQFCFCGDDISLQSVSGGASKEGLFGRVTLKVNGEYVDYVRSAPVTEVVPVACHKCKNKGKVLRTVRRYQHFKGLSIPVDFTEETDCPECNGSGTLYTTPPTAEQLRREG